ncbi:MAG: hypothetical protein ACTHLT_06465 [Devosia sp.]
MPDFRIAAALGGAGLVALLLALPAMLPPAIADEEPAHTLLSSASEIFAPPFNPDRLLKWDFEAEPGVSTEVLRQSTVRKIGYGRTELVQIVETTSGTYSSDALASPNVEYPGVRKHRVRSGQGIATWSHGRWVPQSPKHAGSFATITRFEGGQLIVTDEGMCVTRRHGIICN